ncbi:hypothetical protein [Bradyrhizobium guangdongense]
MRVDFKIALILAVAALPAGAALMVVPEYLHLSGAAVPITFWGGIALAVALILIAAIIALRAELEAPKSVGRWGLKRMWPQYLMAVCGVGFFVGLVAFLVLNVRTPSETDSAASSNEAAANSETFSWRWEPLSPKEGQEILARLQSSDPHQITIHCGSLNCADLGKSLHALFQKLNWPFH